MYQLDITIHTTCTNYILQFIQHVPIGYYNTYNMYQLDITIHTTCKKNDKQTLYTEDKHLEVS